VKTAGSGRFLLPPKDKARLFFCSLPCRIHRTVKHRISGWAFRLEPRLCATVAFLLATNRQRGFVGGCFGSAFAAVGATEAA